MKITKRTIQITIEVFSMDSVLAMLGDVAREYENEATSGTLTMDDGDTVTWKTTHEEVEI